MKDELERLNKTERDREGDGSVSQMQRHCSLLHGFSYFLRVLLLWALRPTQNGEIWRPGNETPQAAIFEVHSRTAETDPTDSTSKFNRLWVILIWCELQLALTRGILSTFKPQVHFRACTLLLSPESFVLFVFFASVILLEKRLCLLLPRLLIGQSENIAIAADAIPSRGGL